MKRENCITQEQMQSLLGAAMAALATSDISIKSSDVEVHPEHVAEIAQEAATVAPEYPEGDPSKWNDEQRTQAWDAYLADNPEDADESAE